MLEGNKIKKLLLKIELIKEEYKKNNKYTMLDSSLMDKAIESSLKGNKKQALKALEVYMHFLTEAQGDLSIPYELGKELDVILNDEEHDVLIHRTNLGLDENNNSETLEAIMRDGLINFGHINAAGGGGMIEGYPDLSLTTTIMDGITGYFNLFGNWHGNDSIIILKVPKGEFEGMNNPEEIYNVVDGKYYIKPEYIVGNIARNKDEFINFKSREEILEMSHKR